jgi:subtilase family protein
MLGSHRVPALVALLSVAARVSAAQSDVPMQGIDHHNRVLLVRSRLLGKTDAIVLVLARMGAAPHVMEQLRALGAEVQAHFDDVGYLRVRLPLAQFARVQRLPDVIDARIDAGYLSYGYDQGTDTAAIKLVNQAVQRTMAKPDTTGPLPPAIPAAAGAATPGSNPWIPMADMGSPQFRRTHPTYDGRGVTIGVLEGGVLDLTHPALQGARSVTGDSVPKVVAIITPSSYDADPEPRRLESVLTRDTTPNVTRVRRTGPIDAVDGMFSAEGRMYHAPRPGRYSFGMYTGWVKVPGGPYPVLWDSGGRVWVDTNRDRDFSDEAVLGDFNRTHTTGYLRRDSTAAKPGRSVSFAVAFDSGGTALHLYEGTQGHQTMVASVAAGHGLLGGVDASAPGARLIIVDAGASLGDAIEGFIRAERDPRIDLITSSQVGETFPATGESIFALVLERLVRRYGKPIFAAAGNSGPRMSLPIEPASAPGVISVGGYVGRDSYLAHYGWHMTSPDWLIAYSARGPTLDGAMKPDVLAPVLSIAAAPCSDEQKPARYLVYTLPPCYMLGGGTSSATPHAAGAGALLISAAKQAGVPHDAARLAWALRTGARPLSGYGVHEQGAGLIDVPKAWDLLRGPIQAPDIQVDAPTRTLMDPYLRRPGHGRGLYEREGWAPGDTGTRTITLRRTSGPRVAITYGLRWRGNDGTFTALAQHVSLPFNQPVDVRVRIAPKTAGVHSTALEVMDPAGFVAYQVLATIVAAHQLTATNAYTVRLHGTAEWPRPISFFVHVPPSARALRVEMQVNRGRLGLQLEDPATLDNLEWQTYFKGYRYPFSYYVHLTPGQSGVQLIPRPQAGVWELTATPVSDPTFGGDSVQYRTPGDVELRVSALGVEGNGGTGPRSGASSTGVDLAFANQLAPLAGATTAAELGARRAVTGTVDSLTAGPTYDIAIDSGTTSLRLAVEPTSDSLAHLDLYLFDCTTGTCFLWDVDFVHGSRADLLVHTPRPGKWKAVIDPARVQGGTTGFTYTEVVTHPAFGTVTVDSIATPRPTGALWIERANVRAGAVVPSGHDLVLVVDVVDRQSERDETAHPLAVFGGAPYRPVPVATAVVSLGAKPANGGP